MLSGSSHGDVKGTLDSGEGGVGWTLIDRGIPFPISVIANHESGGYRLDARRFHSICINAKLFELRDRSGARRDMAVAAWTKPWKLWGCGPAAECETSSSETDMFYVRVFEENIYEHKLRELIASLLVKDAHLKMHEDGAPASPSIPLVVLRWPFDCLWFCRAHEICK